MAATAVELQNGIEVNSKQFDDDDDAQSHNEQYVDALDATQTQTQQQQQQHLTGNSSEHDWSSQLFPVFPYGFHGDTSVQGNGWRSVISHNNKHASLSSATDSIATTHDLQLNEHVLELIHNGNVQNKYSTYIEFPAADAFIGTTFAIVNAQIKYLQRYVAIAIEIRDNSGKLRTFKCSNAVSVGKVQDDSCELPLLLQSGWNRVQLDLRYLTHMIFGTAYQHTTRVKVYASCRLRRLYFSDAVYRSNKQLPLCLQVPRRLALTTRGTGQTQTEQREHSNDSSTSGSYS